MKCAYDCAVRAHEGQILASGDLCMSHTIQEATILAQLRLATDTVVAGPVRTPPTPVVDPLEDS